MKFRSGLTPILWVACRVFLFNVKKGTGCKTQRYCSWNKDLSCDECARVVNVVLFLPRLETYGKSYLGNTELMRWMNLSMVSKQLSKSGLLFWGGL